MEDIKLDEAVYIINLKIAKTLREKAGKDFNELYNEISKLKHERNQIYKGDVATIKKVLNQYIKDVKLED